MQHAPQHAARRLQRQALAWATAIAAGLLLNATPGIAAEADRVEPGAAAEAETTPPPRVDLGAFHVRDLRPTRDITANLKFSLYLVLRDEVSEAAVDALDHWKHRLRDQTITAIRTAQMVDFADPDLTRVRRLIRLRMNLALPQPLVEEILITTFTLGDL